MVIVSTHAVCSGIYVFENISHTGCPQNGRVRLVGGEGNSAGRLELCYKGEWSPFSTTSGFGYNEGAAACRNLGFLQYPSE